MGGYFQYLQHSDQVMKQLYETEIGAAPFGEGLQRWLKESPGFNLDKVNAPVMVVGNDRLSVLLMWETYAGLRVLHKPVDLIMLSAYEHVLTKPGARAASQGGTVDWFRFWLQGYEDPDPVKAGRVCSLAQVEVDAIAGQEVASYPEYGDSEIPAGALEFQALRQAASLLLPVLVCSRRLLERWRVDHGLVQFGETPELLRPLGPSQ